jgi:GNAT superfamily N-acetyltransferase
MTRTHFPSRRQIQEMEDPILRPVRLDTDTLAVSSLIVDYLTWAIERLRTEYGVEDPPTTPGAVADSLRHFTPPEGLMIVAERDGELVGVGAIRKLEPGIAEMKRFYVDPKARGQRIGSNLLARLVHEARETFQATTMRLDTCRFMVDAQRLYTSHGFVERSPYEGTETPPHLQKFWQFFEMEI